MIRVVSNIMIKDYHTVDALQGIQKTQDMAIKNQIEYFLVVENNEIVGILTSKNLMKAHPNRIVADAMSNNLVTIEEGTVLWKAKEIMYECNTEVLLVGNKEKPIGLVTINLINIELGKHIDLLTGLYKSDYIYYNGMKLLEEGNFISYIFIDIDNFGKIDKEYGHYNGDMILKEVGIELNKNICKESYLCRFGGDEFVILTPYSIIRSEIFAKQLTDIIGSRTFLNNKIKLNISAGISGGRLPILKGHNNLFDVVSELINISSLASTRAKKESSRVKVINSKEISDIA